MIATMLIMHENSVTESSTNYMLLSHIKFWNYKHQHVRTINHVKLLLKIIEHMIWNQGPEEWITLFQTSSV